MNHSFDIKIATEYGLNEAIIFNNIYFWIKKNKSNNLHFYENNYWTFNSYKAFVELFPYFSERQVRYAIENLIKKGIIIKGNFNIKNYDNTNWYALTEKGWGLTGEINKIVKPSDKSDSIDLTNLSDGLDNIVRPIPDINTDINTNINKDNMSLAKASKGSLVKVNEFVEFFSKICPSLPQIQIMSDKRKKALNNIIKQYGKDTLIKVLKKAETSDFLSGRNGKWSNCNIDWILKPANFIKILEGNYDNIRQKETEEQKLNKEFKKTYIENNQFNAKSLKIKKSFDKVEEYAKMFERPKIEVSKNE